MEAIKINKLYKGIWIPIKIWEMQKLSLQEKVFLAEIERLDHVNGCFASNAYFARFSYLSKNRCSEIIRSLENKGKITIKYMYDKDKKNIVKRIIKVIDKSNSHSREDVLPYSESCEENDINSNHINENIPYTEIIDYLNKKAKVNYRSSNRRTRELIKIRYNEGYRIEDFKQVINIKSAEWLNNEKMQQFLRPSTLFGDKFEIYVNQKGSVHHKKNTNANQINKTYHIPF